VVDVSQPGGDGVVEGGEAETTRRRWRGEGRRGGDGAVEGGDACPPVRIR
jgi:hypothetical protein